MRQYIATADTIGMHGRERYSNIMFARLQNYALRLEIVFSLISNACHIINIRCVKLNFNV